MSKPPRQTKSRRSPSPQAAPRSVKRSARPAAGKPTGRPTGKPAGKHTGKPRGERRPTRSGPRPGGQRSAPVASPETGGAQRLQKVLAAAGLGSRRQCEQLILDGRVEIDGHTVTELGTRVDPSAQQIRLDGQRLHQQRKVYYVLNKPSGTVSTSDDPAGRPRVLDLLPNQKERLFTVGRLDLASEGLILVTNDGELANRLAHPRYEIEKTYQVLVAGVPTPETLDQLQRGIYLSDGFARVQGVRIKTPMKQSAVLEMVLSEGKNREIRRVLARVGHKVMRLRRVALGPLRLKDLAPGQYRRLSSDELRALKAARPASSRPATGRLATGRLATGRLATGRLATGRPVPTGPAATGPAAAQPDAKRPASSRSAKPRPAGTRPAVAPTSKKPLSRTRPAKAKGRPMTREPMARDSQKRSQSNARPKGRRR